MKHWAKALLAAVITGASSSGLSALGISVADAAGLKIGQLNLQQLGIMMASGGLVGAFAYLKQSPVPPDETETTEIKP